MANAIQSTLAVLSLCIAMQILPARAEPAPGMTRLVDTSNAARPLTLSVWYPSATDTLIGVGGSAVFVGVSASVAAPDEGGRLPLVLLSHGGLRSAPDSGAWLAAALASAGFLVVEINAPRPVSAEDAVEEIWRRPADLTRALDLILADPVWAERVDHDAISAVGFALGGTAVLAIAGAGPDPDRYRRTCAGPAAQGPDCGWFAAQGVSPADTSLAELARSRRDTRITSIVTINPEYAELLNRPEKAQDVHTLFVSLGGSTVPGWEGSQNLELPGATAFDAFALCTPAGPEILRDEGEDPALCATPAATREAIHGKVADAIIGFLIRVEE